MDAYKENEEIFSSQFPVDVFISDNMEKNIDVNPHWHDCIEILYVLEGNAWQKLNEKFFRIAKNDIVILGSGDIHSTSCAGGECVKILVLKFQPGVIEPAYSNIIESGYIVSFLNSSVSRHFNLESSGIDLEGVYELFTKLYKEFSEKRTGYEIYIKGYMYQIIGVFLRNGLIQLYHPGEWTEELKRLNPLLNYIEKNYNEEINVKDAAKMVNLSYYYFSRYFKKMIGKSFVEYIDYVRVCEAERLISSGNMRIADAAFEVGFKNICSFNKVYRRIRGFTPGVFKANSAKK
jgi:AraC-like DNA-binding protein